MSVSAQRNFLFPPFVNMESIEVGGNTVRYHYFRLGIISSRSIWFLEKLCFLSHSVLQMIDQDNESCTDRKLRKVEERITSSDPWSWGKLGTHPQCCCSKWEFKCVFLLFHWTVVIDIPHLPTKAWNCTSRRQPLLKYKSIAWIQKQTNHTLKSKF